MSRCPGKLFRIVLLGFLVWLSPDAAWAQSSQAMLLGRVSQETTGAAGRQGSGDPAQSPD